MDAFRHWFIVFVVSTFITLGLSGPVFYQMKKVETGALNILGNDFSSVWKFRLVFYFVALLVYIPLTMLIYWLYDRVSWFQNRWYVISLTLLLADRITSSFWIWYFNKELPDMWMIWGMVSLLFCLTISAVFKN